MMASQSLANGAGAAKKGIASPWHMALVVVLGALNAYRSAIFAAQSRARLGPARTVMYLRIMFFELAFLTIVAAGVWLQGTSLETIFGRRWSGLGQVLRDLGAGAGLWIVAMALVSVLGGHGQAPDRGVEFLIPRTAIEYLEWVGLAVVAGICEEAIFRGYLQKQFALRCSPEAPGGRVFFSGGVCGGASVSRNDPRAGHRRVGDPFWSGRGVARRGLECLLTPCKTVSRRCCSGSCGLECAGEAWSVEKIDANRKSFRRFLDELFPALPSGYANTVFFGEFGQLATHAFFRHVVKGGKPACTDECRMAGRPC